MNCCVEIDHTHTNYVFCMLWLSHVPSYKHCDVWSPVIMNLLFLLGSLRQLKHLKKSGNSLYAVCSPVLGRCQHHSGGNWGCRSLAWGKGGTYLWPTFETTWRSRPFPSCVIQRVLQQVGRWDYWSKSRFLVTSNLNHNLLMKWKGHLWRVWSGSVNWMQLTWLEHSGRLVFLSSVNILI